MQIRDSVQVRRNLSDDLADRVRAMIFDGQLAAGVRINEVHLALEMGVSRTPLREALQQLVAEEAISSVPRRGFFVRPLTLQEAQQIYPIRAFLDPEALHLSGIPDTERFRELERTRLRLEKARSVKYAIALDEDWHRMLWADCPNSVLTNLIEQFILRTRRYELASMGDPQIVRSSAQSKKQIQVMLRRRDLDGACRQLRESLLHGGEPVFAWLRAREEQITK